MMKASRKCVLLGKALEEDYSNHKALHFTLEPELEPASIASLAGRDAQEVLYTGFSQTPRSDSKWLQFLPDICNANIHKTTFPEKTNTVLNELLNGWYRES